MKNDSEISEPQGEYADYDGYQDILHSVNGKIVQPKLMFDQRYKGIDEMREIDVTFAWYGLMHRQGPQ